MAPPCSMELGRQLLMVRHLAPELLAAHVELRDSGRLRGIAVAAALLAVKRLPGTKACLRGLRDYAVQAAEPTQEAFVQAMRDFLTDGFWAHFDHKGYLDEMSNLKHAWRRVGGSFRTNEAIRRKAQQQNIKKARKKARKALQLAVPDAFSDAIPDAALDAVPDADASPDAVPFRWLLVAVLVIWR